MLLASDFVLGLLREGFMVFESNVNPVVKARAAEKHPDKWLHECKMCVGFAMKQHMKADSIWDTYTLTSVIFML